MSILTYSQEIMYLSIAFGVLLITLLFAWLLFYIVIIIKDLRTIVSKTRETLNTAHEVVAAVKTKIDETSIQFKFLIEGIKSIADWVKNKKQPEKENPSHTSDNNTIKKN